ncbi:MAG: glycosyltransferase family 2 protein [Butyrivibrio sp.]|nr:glycosyltransferase family 2 protein [Butyrivibrio sp.]
MNNENKLVSIIVPVYQAKDTLKKCVLSCLNQKFIAPGELEVILVDDGSTDGSTQICDELERDDETGCIRVVHTKNFGVSHARNIGLQQAAGRFIAFVDSDDEVESGYLENLMKYADEGTALLDETDIYSGAQKISGFQYIENVILRGNSHVWGKLFDRETVAQNHIMFEEGLTIGEDLLFLLDFALSQEKKHTIKCTSTGGYFYTENENGAMKSAFKAGYMDEIKCWKSAEEKLLPYRDSLSRYAYVSLAVSQIMTAFLVIGKVAALEESDRDNDLAKLAVSQASEQIRHGLRTQGAFAGLSFGYKLKVILFKISPSLYLKMYHRHKA